MMNYDALSVRNYTIYQDAFYKLANKRKQALGSKDIVVFDSNHLPSDSELSKAKIIYAYVICEKWISEKVGNGTTTKLGIPTHSPLEADTLYLRLENDTIFYKMLGMSAESSFENSSLIENIRNTPHVADSMSLALHLQDQFLLFDTIRQKMRQLTLREDEYEENIVIDMTPFKNLMNSLIPQTNDSCIFALQVNIPFKDVYSALEEGPQTIHSVPFIFNKKGESLYYCSIPGLYDRKVRELQGIINDALGLDRAINFKAETILQNDSISCSFYTASALLTLDPSLPLSAQAKPIAEMLQKHMKNTQSKKKLRKDFLKQLRDIQNSAPIPNAEQPLVSENRNLLEGQKPVDQTETDKIKPIEEAPPSIIDHKLADAAETEVLKQQIVHAFKKIYEATRKGQTSLFKNKSFLKRHPTLSFKTIAEYAANNPQSRTAQAFLWAIEHPNNLNSADLVFNIHNYALKHSFFGKTLNQNNIKTNFDQIKKTIRPNSRTANIIKTLEI